MYSKDEKRDLKKRFWDGLSAYAENYAELRNRRHKFMLHNTRLKGVTMKFDATRDGAYVILEIDHRNEDQQEKLYNHFLEHRELLESAFDTPLIVANKLYAYTSNVAGWIFTTRNNGTISTIFW